MSGGTGGSNAGTGSSGTGGSGSGKRSIHSSTGGTGGSVPVEKPGKSGITRQMNMFLRTKSDSGKRLSDAVSNNGSRKFGTYSNDCFWSIHFALCPCYVASSTFGW